MLRLIVKNAPVYEIVQHGVVRVATRGVLLAGSAIDVERAAGLAGL